jgi:hypothetical protein
LVLGKAALLRHAPPRGRQCGVRRFDAAFRIEARSICKLTMSRTSKEREMNGNQRFSVTCFEPVPGQAFA